MLGKNKSVDNRFSDLQENAKILKQLVLVECVKYWRAEIRWVGGGIPSAGIWPLRLGVNPDVL